MLLLPATFCISLFMSLFIWFKNTIYISFNYFIISERIITRHKFPNGLGIHPWQRQLMRDLIDLAVYAPLLFTRKKIQIIFMCSQNLALIIVSAKDVFLATWLSTRGHLEKLLEMWHWISAALVAYKREKNKGPDKLVGTRQLAWARSRWCTDDRPTTGIHVWIMMPKTRKGMTHKSKSTKHS